MTADLRLRTLLVALACSVCAASCGGQSTGLQINLAVSSDQLDEVGTLPLIEVSITVAARAPEVLRFSGRDRAFKAPTFAFGTPLSISALGKNANGETLYSASARDLTATSGAPFVASLPFRRTNDFARTLGAPTAARRFHTATRLSDGRVLLVGGHDGDNRALNSAELFDPASARFTPTAGTLAQARGHHAAVLLQDGRVLIAGGRDGDTYWPTIELFDPATSSFSAAGTLSIERAELTATRYETAGLEKVLFAGGRNARGPHANADVYVPSTRTIAAPKMMSASRAGHASAPVNGGVVLFGGGDTLAGDLFNFNEERFAPTTAAMSAQRLRATAVALTDGRILIGGGSAAIEVFDVTQNRITTWSQLAAPIDDLVFAPLSGTSTLVAGGAVQGAPQTTAFTSQNGAPLPTVRPLDVPRAGHTATALQDGTVLIAGGSSTATAEVYAPAARR